MAAEADIPEAMSVTKGEGEERYLPIGQFDRTVDQCSPVELDKSKGESDQHPETVKHFTESEHTPVGCSMQVESKNNSFGTSEGGIFLASLSDPKVDKLETCISENSQADESNKAEMEMPENEKQLQKGKQFGASEEPGSEENEVMEETNKKAEQDIKNHDIVNVRETISEMAETENTQIKGEALDTGEASAGEEKDSQGFAAVAADNINDTEPIQAIEHSKMNSTEHEGETETNLFEQIEPIKYKLERPLSYEENEAATLRENAKKIITAEEEREVINLEQSLQEEGKEEKAITIAEDDIPEEKNLPVTDTVKKTESGEAERANSNAKDSHGTQSSDVEAGQVEGEKIYEVSKLEADEKFQRSNASSIEEEKDVENTSGVYGLDPNENIEVKDAVENIQEEIKEKEVTDTKIHKITSDDTEEHIISNDTPVKVYNTVLVGDTAEQSSQVQSLEEAEPELRVEDEGFKSEDPQRNSMVVEAVLDEPKITGRDFNKEQTKEGNATVFVPESNEEESVVNSHDNERGTEKLKEEGSSIEGIKEGNSNDLSPEYIPEDGSEKFKDEKQDAMTSEGEILKESESARVGDSTACEPNKNVERSEEFLHTSTAKREEGQQGEGKSPAPTKASEEDDRDEDTFSFQVAEDNDDNNGAATVTETRAEVTSNGEEDSQQALQKYEPGEELQKFLDVMPEETNTESSSENAEVITCTKEEGTIQNREESSEKEKKEETKTRNNTKENETAMEEVIETTSIEEAGEHALREIHTVEDHPQEFNDKEKNEENSTEYQACIEAADLSANTEENNLEEQDVQELSSSFKGEETKQISKEAENYATNLKQEEKEAHEKCEEPIEATSMTEEPISEIIEDRTEPNKDLYAPISEEEIHAEESNKAIVINNSFLSEVSETKIEKEVQEKNGPTVSNSDPLSAVVSHETGLKEVVAEHNEKGLATILTDERTLNIEDIDQQAQEIFNSTENLEKPIPTTVVEGETGLKEAAAENKEQVTNADVVPEEKDLATTLKDGTSLASEDIDVQTEENLNSKEDLEKQIPTAPDESETGLKEAEAENNEQVKNTNIAPEEKGLATILTDETALDNEEIDVQEEEIFSLKENSEKQIPTASDEGEMGLKEVDAENNEQAKNTDIAPEEKGLATILTDETALDIEGIDVQEDENFISKENLEEQNPTTADEGKTGLKEVEAENKEQTKNSDTASEEKGPATILTDETALAIEDIDVQREENLKTKEHLENKIPTATDEGETGLKEAEAENNEQIKNTDIAPEGLVTILTDETALNIEEIDVQEEENFSSKENLEEQIPTTADGVETGLKKAEAQNNEQAKITDIAHGEKGLAIISTDDTSLGIQDIDVGETGLNEAETENKEQDKNIDIAPEEKGLETILTDETALGIEDLDVQAEESFNSKEDLEKQIPKATDEGETGLKESEAENNEHVKNTLIAPEEKGLATILTDEAASDIEDIYVQAEENFNSKENFETQIPTAADEGETGLKGSEDENNEQVKNTDLAPEEKGLATILTDEAALAIEDIYVQAEENFNTKENWETQIPTAADEGETGLRGSEAENNEQVKNTDLAPEEKGPATILTDEKSLDIENVDVQAEENFNSKDKLEKQIPTIADGGEEKIEYRNIIVDDTPVEVYNTELVGDKTVEQSFQVQSLEEAEPKLGGEDDGHKSEGPPEKNDIIVEELQLLKQVPNEPKITDRDFNKEQTTEGNVSIFIPESIEETVKNSQDNEKETEKLKEEGSSLDNIKEGNVNDLSPAYIPEDGSEKFKDDKQDSVKSKGEILEKSEIAGVDERTTCETNKNAEISEETLNTLPVYEEGQREEDNSPATTKASKEENRDEDTYSVEMGEDNDDDIGVVPVTVMSKKETPNGVGDSPQALQKYEPGKELQESLEVMPEATKMESSSENAEVITCTEEERTIQNIQESSDKEREEEVTKDMNNTKENDTAMEEVLETTSREQDTREHELQEIHTVEDHPQGFHHKDTTEENHTEYQACIEAADLSISAEKKNLEGQVIPELSSSLVGEETAKEYSKVEEDYVTNLKEEKADVECKEPIEIRNMTQETKSETLEDRTEPNKDLYSPISEEEAHTDESNKTLAQTNSFLSEVTEKEIENDIQEKDGSTVSNYDSVSGVVSHETGLKEAEVENNEQVKNTDICPEEKGLATILTDGTTLDFEVIDVQAEENVKTNENLEKQIQTVADEGEEKMGHENIILDDTPVKVYNTELVGDRTIEQSFQVQRLAEAEPNLRVEDESHKSEDHPDKNNIIVEELQLLKLVPDEPKITDRDFNKEQTTEGNVAIFTPESIEVTVKNSQGNEKETEKLKEEGSSVENIKEGNANDLSPECIPEDGSEKFKDDEQDAVKSKGEIHKESQIGGVDETTAYETNKNAESSEEILNASPVTYEGHKGGGDGPASTKASREEDRDENTFSVKVAEDDDDKNGAATVTEKSANVTSNGEEESAQVLQKYEPGEEQVQVKTSDLAYENKVCNLEVKVSELALEKLDVDATEEEIKEGSEMVLKSGSQSIDVVSKEDIIAEQKLYRGISNEQLQKPSTLLSEETELKASEHEHGTTTQDKNFEEEHAKEMEVPADEDAGEETHLQKEEPRELKASELAPEKLDAGETEEEIKETVKMVSKSDSQSIDAASKDEIVADQTVPEEITDMQLHIPSYTLLPKGKELEAYQQEPGTTAQDKSIEEEHTKEKEVPAHENRGDLFAARSAEETCLPKEEPRELKVSELAPEMLNAGETEEEFKETFETESKYDSQSTDVVSKDETIVDQALHREILDEQLQIPSSTFLPEENELKASQQEHGTMAQEENTLEKGFTEFEDTRINKKHLEVAMFSSIEENPCETTVESNETIKNEVSNEGKHLDVAIADSRAEENWCETTIEANEIAKNEVSNEEIKDDKEVEGTSQTISIGEENIRESEQEDESRDEKYLGEKNETFDAATNEKQYEEVSEVYEKGSMSGKVEEQITSEDTTIKDHDPFVIKDKTTQDSFPEAEGRNAGEAAEKDSSTEISKEEGTLGFEEANEITQDIKQLEKASHAATSIPTGNKEVVNILQDPIVETSQGVELEDAKPRNDTWVATEIKAEECGKEKMSESGAISLADLMHEPTKERTPVVTHLTEEKEPTASKALQTEEEEEEEEHGNGEEVKTDEEKEDEQKKADPGYDSPIIVEASDVKVSPKKSHNILSGMGSKVKHSISKVKKAIIGGKSSNSKTQSEK